MVGQDIRLSMLAKTDLQQCVKPIHLAGLLTEQVVCVFPSQLMTRVFAKD